MGGGGVDVALQNFAEVVQIFISHWHLPLNQQDVLLATMQAAGGWDNTCGCPEELSEESCSFLRLQVSPSHKHINQLLWWFFVCCSHLRLFLSTLSFVYWSSWKCGSSCTKWNEGNAFNHKHRHLIWQKVLTLDLHYSNGVAMIPHQPISEKLVTFSI